MGKVIMSGIVPQLEAPSTGILASELTVGSTVKLMENGVAVDYIVVNQGKPSGSSLYDNSCDDTWMLRKAIYENREWHSSNRNNYAESTIHSYLNSTFFDRFGDVERSAIKQAKIPFVNGVGMADVASGSSGLSTKVFLLSAYEVGGDSNQSYAPEDGARLSFFSSGSGTTAKEKRVGYLNGTASIWMLRSAPKKPITQNAYSVKADGGLDSGITCTTANGVRPALILPNTAIFDEETMILKGVS